MMKRMLIPMAMAAAMLAVIAGGAAEPAATRQIKFHAPKTVIDHQKKLVVATGGVELTTTEGTLWADKVEAITDDENRLQTAEATGNVRVDLDWTGSDKKRRRVKAQGDRATYDAAARTVVLIGHVKGNAVEVDKQRTIDLKGHKATLDLQHSIYAVEAIEGTPTEIIFTEPEPKPETAPK